MNWLKKLLYKKKDPLSPEFDFMKKGDYWDRVKTLTEARETRDAILEPVKNHLETTPDKETCYLPDDIYDELVKAEIEYYKAFNASMRRSVAYEAERLIKGDLYYMKSTGLPVKLKPQGEKNED